MKFIQITLNNQTAPKLQVYISFESDLIWSSTFLSPSTANSLDLYDDAEYSTYAYASSDDDLFSEATTILD